MLRRGFVLMGCTLLLASNLLLASEKPLTLDEKIADLDAALGDSLTPILAEGPALVDTSEYEAQVRDAVAKTDLSEEQKTALLQERLPLYVEDFKSTLIADELKAVLSDFSRVKVTRVARLLPTGDLPTEQVAPLFDYYKKESVADLGAVTLVLARWVGKHTAAYVMPRYIEEVSEGDFADTVEVAGKKIHLAFHWKARPLNGDYYMEKAIQIVFGSPYVIFCDADAFAKGDLRTTSILVHELRHYLDSIHPSPTVTKEKLRQQKEILAKLWDQKRPFIMGEEYAQYKTLPGVVDYLAAKLWIEKHQEPGLDLAAQVAKVEQLLLEDYEESAHDRFNYLYNAMEIRAYREQIRFLKNYAHLRRAEMIALMSVREKSKGFTPKVQLDDGRVVPLSAPPAPINYRYFYELYDQE